MSNTDEKWYEWVEPVSEAAHPLYMHAPARTCMALFREAHPGREITDELALDNFIVIYWATETSWRPVRG
jgi:hypothetical protein